MPWANITSLHLDLASFRSIRQFVAAFEGLGLPLHGLVNNASGFTPPPQRTQEGFMWSLG